MNDTPERPLPLPDHASESSQLSSLLRAAIERSTHSMMILHQRDLLLANMAAKGLFNLNDSALNQRLKVEGPGGLLIERIEETIAASPGKGKASFEYHLSGGGSDAERILTVTATPLDADHMLVEASPSVRLFDSEAAKTASQLRHNFKTPLSVIKLGLSHFSHNYAKLSEQERLSIIEDITQEITRLTSDVDKLAVAKK